MPLRLLAVLALCAAALAARPATAADDLTPAQKKAIEAVVHDYLMNHPEVLIDALQAAEDKIKSDAEAKAAKVLNERHREIFDNPDSPVGGNPKGDVSLVEFFDYRCPYCKQVEPSVEALIAQDHKLRVVYKEFPVLGPASTTAARVALAARKQGKYEAFHTAMMATKGQIGDDTVYAVAGKVGLDLDRVKRDMAAPEIDKELKANLALADALDLRGTPAFIVGSRIIPGAVELDGLKQAVAEARGK